jgi:DNA repair exonuclease SbcCD ATPase subunit
MIVFEKIRWKNFLSTGNQFTEINLIESPSTLIVGSNGAGKSTLLDALCFGLFNKPFRKINKPQLVNSINEKECVVEIEFNIGSTSYKVVRGIKPGIFEIKSTWNKVSSNLITNLLLRLLFWEVALLFLLCSCLLLIEEKLLKTSWISKYFLI